MEFSLYSVLVSLIGGLIAGAINTLAGNGSAISLGILTEVLGLPGNIANGTNRIGVLAQGLASSAQFSKKKGLFSIQNKSVILWTVLGALVGVYLATVVSSDQFTLIYKYMMVIMLFVIVTKPKKWLKQSDNSFNLPSWILIPSFFAIGIYGGFIQMGMGIFFLAIMVLLARRDIIESNIIKILVVTIYTAIVLAIFQYKGLVDWKAGLFLAVGQAFGGYLTTKFALENERAGKIAYYLLISIVIVVIIRLFLNGF